jgi:hypothetical protein
MVIEVEEGAYDDFMGAFLAERALKSLYPLARTEVRLGTDGKWHLYNLEEA